MSMKTKVRWAGDMTFIGYGENNKHGVVMDGGTDVGGLGIGASPMEMLLMGVGGCASVDIVMIMKKARQNITDCIVEVSGERREEMPRRFTKVHLHFILSGKDLKANHAERAVQLSMEKYCSASATLAEACELTWDWESSEAK